MLYANCFGSKENPPLIFLHGFLGSSSDFSPLIKFLKNTFFCIAFDLPGHGHSEMINDLSFQSVVQILKSEIQKHSFDNVYLLGYSLGGRLAMGLDESYPEICKRILLVGSHFGLHSEEEKRHRYESDLQWSQLLKKEGLYKFLKKWYRQPIFTTLCSTPEMLEKMINKRIPQNIKALQNYLKHLSLSKQMNYKDHILTTPEKYVLFSGDKDLKFKTLYNSLKICHEPIMETTHAPHLEKPQELASLVIKHLKKENL